MFHISCLTIYIFFLFMYLKCTYLRKYWKYKVTTWVKVRFRGGFRVSTVITQCNNNYTVCMSHPWGVFQKAGYVTYPGKFEDK